MSASVVLDRFSTPQVRLSAAADTKRRDFCQTPCDSLRYSPSFVSGTTLFKGYVTGREVLLINDGHAGACKAEVDQYCFEVKPGEGRLAKCLQEQLVEQQKSENTDTKVTEACKTELDDFLIDRSGRDILDVSLYLDTMFWNGCCL